MRKKLIYFLFFIFGLYNQNTFAGSIIGLEEAISDTSTVSLPNRFDKVLSLHPLISNQSANEYPMAKIRSFSNKTVVFLLAVFLLFLFSLVRILFPRYFINLFQIFTGMSISKRHIKEQLENDNRASLWFYSIFLISIGFIVFQIVNANSGMRFSDKGYINYLVCTLMVLFLFGFRMSMIHLTGWIFKRSDYVRTYLFNTKLVYEFSGLILFPLCILMLVSSGKIQYSILMIASGLSLIFFAFGYLRNIPELRNLFRLSFVHFLLYLCAFELIPVLVLIKIIR